MTQSLELRSVSNQNVVWCEQGNRVECVKKGGLLQDSWIAGELLRVEQNRSGVPDRQKYGTSRNADYGKCFWRRNVVVRGVDVESKGANPRRAGSDRRSSG